MAAGVSSELQFVNKGINVHGMLLNLSPDLALKVLIFRSDFVT